MLTLIAAIVTLVAMVGLFFLLARARRPHVKFEAWPREGARFRTHTPLKVTVIRDWPMDICEADLAVGVELVVHARPDGAPNVTCDPISRNQSGGGLPLFVDRPNPKDPYRLSVEVEGLKTCCEIV